MAETLGLKAIRAAIQAYVNSYFGRSIHIDERCFQTLELGFNRDGRQFARQLFYADPSLVERYFAMWKADNTLPVDRRMFVPPDDLTPRFQQDEYFLHFYFRSPRDSDVRLYAADNVIETGRLTCEDFILGAFDRVFAKIWMYDIEETPGPGARVAWADEVKYVCSLFRQTKNLDPSHGEQLWIVSPASEGYHIRPFALYGGFNISDLGTRTGQPAIVRGNILQPLLRFKASSLEELEFLIHSSAPESVFQRFFEDHEEFLLALGAGMYSQVHPQLILHEDTGGFLIPDFFLEKVDSDFCDILDLKTSTAKLRRIRRNRNTFRSVIFDTVAQLEKYRNWFEDRENRKIFHKKYGLNAYRPRVVAIVGRSRDYYTDIERIRLEGILPSHFELITYDEVVQRVRTLLSITRA